MGILGGNMFAWIWSCMVIAFKASLGGFFWGVGMLALFMVLGLFVQLPFDDWLDKLKKFGKKE